MTKNSVRILFGMLVLVLAFASHATQVIVKVGKIDITADDLEKAVASSPFSVQFSTMDEGQQAALRGDMLQRLVASRLLYLEAQRLGLDKSVRFQNDLALYRDGLLYRAYMNKLRDGITIPAEDEKKFEADYKDNPDALAAAQSAYIAKRYSVLKPQRVAELRTKYHVVTYDERIRAGMSADTVLGGSDLGVVHYKDLAVSSEAFDKAEIGDSVAQQLDVAVVAREARAGGMSVDDSVISFQLDRLPSLLLTDKAKQWVPNEAAARAYFDKHPDIGFIAENRHVIQLVVADKATADKLRGRIVKGESIFQLAEQYSIDPYGKKHAGDMGWLPAGSGMPEIEAALAKLKDGELSDVVKSPKGYHLVMIEERNPSKQKSYDAVQDRVKQAMLNVELPKYIKELERRYHVEWKMPMMTPESQAIQSAGN